MIEMPSDMKGLVKSITRSRPDVMVRGATAMSASYLYARRCTINRLTLSPSVVHQFEVQVMHARVHGQNEAA